MVDNILGIIGIVSCQGKGTWKGCGKERPWEGKDVGRKGGIVFGQVSKQIMVFQ